MDYRDLIRIIFWPWLIISCVILIRRFLARRSGTRDLEPSGPASTDTGPAPTSAGPVPPSTSPPLTSGIPHPPPDAAELSGPPERPAAREPPERPPSVFDPTPAATQPRAASGSPRSLPEMLQGIRLPCGLVPVVEFEHPPRAIESVAFSTREASADVVGSELGEELRRLGFSLEAVDVTQAVATRGAERFHVGIHAQPSQVRRTDRAAFPTVGADSVVVELWSGPG